MIDQLVIGTCGVATVFLSQSKDVAVQRWACVVGLVAQPAWMWSAWHAGQWAIVGLTFVYTLGWLRGVRNFWWRAPA